MKIDRIEEENHNKFGTKMKIVEYVNAKNIIVEFQDEHKTKVHTKYCHFINGNVKNPYDKTVYDVGYLGKGKYEASKEGKPTEVYIIWIGMIQRCYDPYELNKHPTYIDCYVCNEWLCFQTFAKWFYKNYYKCNNEKMNLDKDILIKGNKIYSPETCIFVPQRINTLFTKANASRGKYLIGVTWHKREGKYRARCNTLKVDGKEKLVHLGSYNSEFDAFIAYKTFKESYIKQIADEYKELIPKELYNAMYKYEIEIND